MRHSSLHPGERDRDVHPDSGLPEHAPDSTQRRHGMLLPKKSGHAVGRTWILGLTDREHPQPGTALGDTHSGAEPAAGTEAEQRPIGHVIGHELGEPLPPARDPDRPVGRIGPYAEVGGDARGRPIGHVIGLRCAEHH